ncbi:hypothetical protein [Vibrio penaeicida]|uniref:Holin n=1 Tax=Vibrio penaeicida TaxID=104609 RepID=A0AAV5NQK0_9VIBR|nr:hypothetical protein [Vibrio penaeicida]RTZ21738.1 hypothetical protein EKN09_17660 [Vibrio penaeicida]GLQ72900.1 hypothetical protein GCM10007932_22600 [Vibrio penaeicida]
MTDVFDRVTAWLVYLFSATGAFFSTLSLEWWQFLCSLVLGLAMLIINIRHKRAMRKIAREKGIKLQ